MLKCIAKLERCLAFAQLFQINFGFGAVMMLCAMTLYVCVLVARCGGGSIALNVLWWNNYLCNVRVERKWVLVLYVCVCFEHSCWSKVTNFSEYFCLNIDNFHLPREIILMDSYVDNWGWLVPHIDTSIFHQYLIRGIIEVWWLRCILQLSWWTQQLRYNLWTL